jgi:hypothetical protein
MLWFIPAAIFYCMVIGIPSYIGGCLLVLPGFLIASGCAFTIPAGIDCQIGPVAALGRGGPLSTTSLAACWPVRVLCRLRILQPVRCCHRSRRRRTSDSPVLMLSVFGVWFLILLLALALVDIMVTLVYLDARDMSAASPPHIVSRARQTMGLQDRAILRTEIS